MLIVKPKEDKEHQIWQKKFDEDNFRKINTLFKRNNPIEDNAYRISASATLRAESRITIVGDYSPKGQTMNVPSFRQTYFRTIENILKGSEVEFTYCRFMQREKSIIDSLNKENTVIDTNGIIVGDEQAFAHCKRVFEIVKLNPLIKFELYITQFIPSIPSILIIDRDRLLFTIPKSSELEGTDTAGVFEFIDNTKDGTALIQSFYEVTESLKNARVSRRISGIKENLENENPNYKQFLR